MVAAPDRRGILLGYGIGAIGRWAVTALVLTSVAMLAGMEVGGNGVDVFALYTLAALVNVIGLTWSAGVAMRFRSLQAAPLMQLPVFLCSSSRRSSCRSSSWRAGCRRSRT